MISQIKNMVLISTLVLNDKAFSRQSFNKVFHDNSTYIDLRIHTKSRWCSICRNNKINIYTMDSIEGLDVKYNDQQIKSHDRLLCRYLCSSMSLKECMNLNVLDETIPIIYIKRREEDE